MAIFKVSRPSDCGSYFQPYLQSVTIVAESKAQAETVLTQWFVNRGESFVESKYPPEWEVLAEDVSCTVAKVVDFFIDSDY